MYLNTLCPTTNAKCKIINTNCTDQQVTKEQK